MIHDVVVPLLGHVLGLRGGSSQLGHPSDCKVCVELKHRLRYRLFLQRTINVRTWCLKCGEAALISLSSNYERAVEYLKAFDQTPVFHDAGRHAENGGLGIMWRLDEVLRIAFPFEYGHDPNTPYWPRTPWYEHKQSEEREVAMVHKSGGVNLRPSESADRRQRLEEELNKAPMDRPALEERWGGNVWDEQQLRSKFEILGYRNPFIVVRRKVDQLIGTMVFQNAPRFYWGFDPDRII
jgi:hypothetical protein